MPYKFEVYKDKKGEFRFRFIAPNGENMFSGEGYKQKQSAKKAIDLGYTKVKVFAEGYPAWVAAYGKGETTVVASAKSSSSLNQLKAGKEEGSVDTDTFIKIIKNNPESVMLIDVRDADEFNTGSFKTAINIPVEQLEDKIKTLPSDKPVVFVCGTGARSGESFYMVQDLNPEMNQSLDLNLELNRNLKPSPSLIQSCHGNTGMEPHGIIYG